MAEIFYQKNEIVADSKEVKLSNNIFSLTILLAQECNMRCTYCCIRESKWG